MELFDAFEKIIPLVVFILWIFSALFGQKKKKRLPGQDSTKNTKSSSTSKSGTTIFAELRRQMENAIDSTQNNSAERNDVVKGTSINKESPKPVESHSQDDYSLEIERGNKVYDTIETVERNAVTEPVSSVVVPEKLKTSMSLNPYQYKHKEISVLRKRIMAKNLREGILWNEILSPPLGLRE